jgi:hypothetical protein
LIQPTFKPQIKIKLPHDYVVLKEQRLKPCYGRKKILKGLEKRWRERGRESREKGEHITFL